MKRKMHYLLIKIILMIIAFIAGFIASTYFYKPNFLEYIVEKAEPYEIDTTNLVPVNVTINFVTLSFINDCYQISFDVTEDQAYSIARGMEKSLSPRPLTHDIIKDIIDNFGIEILFISIDRYENEIYYARMLMRQGNKVLNLDLRPSDATALSLRLGIPIYLNKDLLKNAEYIC
ncbi:MAG: bifunctional nuclease family protein [Candidatus Aenigmatarchaeota archaeon]